MPVLGVRRSQLCSHQEVWRMYEIRQPNVDDDIILYKVRTRKAPTLIQQAS